MIFEKKSTNLKIIFNPGLSEIVFRIRKIVLGLIYIGCGTSLAFLARRDLWRFVIPDITKLNEL